MNSPQATALVAIALLFIGCGRTQPAASPAPTRLAAAPEGPRLLFVSVASDDSFHHVMAAPLATPRNGAFMTPLVCERVYFNGGHGMCLAPALAPNTWSAAIFDDGFATTGTVAMTGVPSRVRVSPNGQIAAATMFENGHSYAEHGFSTRTSLVDLVRARLLGDLEQFETVREGAVFKAVDFNFWGVTFASDSDTFYATLDTGGVSYLVRGSVSSRRMAIVRPGVECPSLSPDNTRIAFKKRVGARSLGWWQIAVVDLASTRETILTRETRSVDDQVEWLDNDRVTYHLTDGETAADLWTLRADNTADPERLLTSAYSPAVVR
jgi:hypothetical protein